MIMRFLKKIPAGMMVVPMLLGAIINTFIPEVTNIGSFTTAVFTSAGANTAIASSCSAWAPPCGCGIWAASSSGAACC